MSDVSFTDKGLVIPKGKRGLDTMVVDMTTIFTTEKRIPEIQRCTPTTLPELITVFITGMIESSRLIAMVELETKQAKRVMEEARAIALLERAEDVLKSKNIKSSTDTREAAIVLDKDFQSAKEKFDVLCSIQTYLSGKHNAIENAYHGAKKICDVYIRVPGQTTFGSTGEDN